MELADLKRTTSKMTRGRHPRKNCRFGGFLATCTSDGLVTDCFESTGAESLAQRYIFLAQLRKTYPALKAETP